MNMSKRRIGAGTKGLSLPTILDRRQAASHVLNDPRLALSFVRLATKQEMESGTMGLILWSVEPSTDFFADVERGKAIAEEALTFISKSPTVVHLHLISGMLSDLHRQSAEDHAGLRLGFGVRLAQFAAIGIAGVGADTLRKVETSL